MRRLWWAATDAAWFVYLGFALSVVLAAALTVEVWDRARYR